MPDDLIQLFAGKWHATEMPLERSGIGRRCNRVAAESSESWRRISVSVELLNRLWCARSATVVTVG